MALRMKMQELALLAPGKNMRRHFQAENIIQNNC